MTMICPHCGQTHPSNAQFCPITGQALSRRGNSLLPYIISGAAFGGVTMIVIGVIILIGLGSGANQNTPTRSVASPTVIAVAPTLSPTTTLTSRPTAMPSPTLQPTLSPTSIPLLIVTSPALVCPDSYPTRLYVGARAIVNPYPPIPDRVREFAELKYDNILGQIYPNEAVIILEGPVCANNWVWWKVRSEEQTWLTGWTSEGDGRDYWLIEAGR